LSIDGWLCVSLFLKILYARFFISASQRNISEVAAKFRTKPKTTFK
jgi:hypothetical protein